MSLDYPGLSDKHTIPILRDISLEIQEKETISITGASGSGKTSLIMVIAGVEKASAGKVVVAGQDITHSDEDALAAFRKAHIGIVFQNFHLIPTMNALENIRIALEFADHPSPESEAKKWLENVGLGHRMAHYPDQLSGGEQQRVALARAFAPKPKILLADEPTGNLDGQNSEMIIQLLFRLQKEHGTTLVLITHDTHLAAQTSRQLTLDDGRLHHG